MISTAYPAVQLEKSLRPLPAHELGPRMLLLNGLLRLLAAEENLSFKQWIRHTEFAECTTPPDAAPALPARTLSILVTAPSQL